VVGRCLTQTPWEEDKPAWSPDGQRLAFATARGEDGSREIYSMNADGSGQANLTRSPEAHEEHPAWSPNGSTIAFSTFFGIHTIRADGTDRRQLTSNPIGDREPDWSPDGSRIAFTSVSFELGENDEVDTIAADGADRMQITNTALGEAWPKWSSDGTKILSHGSDLRPSDRITRPRLRIVVRYRSSWAIGVQAAVQESRDVRQRE
jgi:Tol biopolymer transport system component